MGEAKRRGSFEDRKKAALEAKKKLGLFQRKHESGKTKRGSKILSLLAAAAMAMPFK